VTTGRPLIVHIVFRLDYGGLENGLVNLINRLPWGDFDHAVIALTAASAFRERILRPDVRLFELHKQPGKDPVAYWRLWKLLRQLRPALVHTRNIGTIECAFVALLAGVPVRIHGEHGWHVHDIDGKSSRYRIMRRTFGLCVNRFVAVSKELERWLVDRVGIASGKVVHICNGVDLARFQPQARHSIRGLPDATFPAGSVVAGSVTRFSAIKDPLNLVRAFIVARAALEGSGINLCLLMAGDGPLRQEALLLISQSGLAEFCWLPGSRDDVPELLQSMDIFVLTSLREGISNTVLEAMASRLPVVASATGGNLELVEAGATGDLVPPDNSEALAQVLVSYARDPALRLRHGEAARSRAERLFSLQGMVDRYRAMYQTCCGSPGVVA
jgi:sugar transferase (PEP-CTERM/EpsH1 system associated)